MSTTLSMIKAISIIVFVWSQYDGAKVRGDYRRRPFVIVSLTRHL